MPIYLVPDKYTGAPLTDLDMIKMYSRSKINLGFAKVGDGSAIKQMRLRDFEVPMSGGFYLTEWWEEIEGFFEPDKEIVCFKDRGELRDKTKFYLSHDAEREKIRMAGYNRARAEHTWEKRFKEVFNVIGVRI